MVLYRESEEKKIAVFVLFYYILISHERPFVPNHILMTIFKDPCVLFFASHSSTTYVYRIEQKNTAATTTKRSEYILVKAL